VTEPDQFEALREAQAHPSPRAWQEETSEGLVFANARLQLRGADAIVRVAQRGNDFDLYLDDGRVVHAGEDLLDPRKFDKAICPVIGRTVPYFTPKDFRGIADAILSARVVEDLGGSEGEETREWIAAFTDSDNTMVGYSTTCPADPAEPVELGSAAELYEALLEDRAAFYGSDGRLYLRVGKLLRWVNQEYRLRVTDRALRRRLGELQFSKPNNDEGQLAARDPKSGRTAARRFLASPEGWTPG
jgi:hypothetical protein